VDPMKIQTPIRPATIMLFAVRGMLRKLKAITEPIRPTKIALIRATIFDDMLGTAFLVACVTREDIALPIVNIYINNSIVIVYLLFYY
jgi:hypothetical protein